VIYTITVYTAEFVTIVKTLVNKNEH